MRRLFLVTLTTLLVLAFAASSFAMVGAEPPAEGEFGIMMLREGESQDDIVDITEVRILQDSSEQTATYEDLNVKAFTAAAILVASLLIIRRKALTHTV